MMVTREGVCSELPGAVYPVPNMLMLTFPPLVLLSPHIVHSPWVTYSKPLALNDLSIYIINAHLSSSELLTALFNRPDRHLPQAH